MKLSRATLKFILFFSVIAQTSCGNSPSSAPPALAENRITPIALPEELQADHTPLTPYTDGLEAQLLSQSPSDLDGFLSSLPTEWRSNYLLVYQSNSLQSASVARPRVILYSKDHQFLLAFGDQSGTGPSDQSVEVIESYGLRPPRFAEISWVGGKPKLERDPSKCTTCHQGAHIFESYPNWPGFFGSTHNGRAYGETSGSGQIARLEFEAQGLSDFIKNSPSLPRYRQLLNLDQATLSSQALRNFLVGSVMIGQLLERQNKQMFESFASLADLRDAFMMSLPIEFTDTGTAPAYPELTTDPRFASYNAFVAKQSPPYLAETVRAAQFRFANLNAAVAKYGTSDDRTRIAVAVPFPDQEASPPIRTDLGIPVAEVMNYFDNDPQFMLPGLHYQFWLANHPEAAPLPINNSLIRTNCRLMDGNAIHNLLQPTAILGFEDLSSNTPYGDDAELSARNYRSFDELYEWVPLPLKQYTWTDFSNDKMLSAAVDGLQKTYLEILANSPLLATSRPEAFKAMRSWSPVNRNTLEALFSTAAQIRPSTW